MSLADRNPITDPHYGFHINRARQHPPVEAHPPEWARRTQSRVYIKRIKRSVELLNHYLWTHRGHGRGCSGHQLDALHYFLDVATFDSERRARGVRKADLVTPAGALV